MRFPLLDGYRALAAVLVVTTHVAFFSGMILVPVVGPLLARMDFGVTLFFVLSGFLLYRPWARSAMLGRLGPRLGTYALRRAGRILPAYWVMALATLLLLPTLVAGIQRSEWSDWLKYLTLTQIYFTELPLAGLGQIWSLATEISFYVALPVIAWLAGRIGRGDPARSTRWQFAVLVAAVALAVFTALATTTLWPTQLGHAQSWLPAHLDWFAVGMAFAVIHARLEVGGAPRWMDALVAIARRPAALLVVAACLWMLAATPAAGPIGFEYPHTAATQITKNVLYAVSAAVLLLPGLLGGSESRSTAWGRALTARPVVFAGTTSYGLFLWHMVIATALVAVIPWVSHFANFAMLWPLTIGLSIAVAALSWFAIERPVQIWTHRSRVSVDAAPARDSR